MPRKTRAEKIIARYRREHEVLLTSQTETSPTSRVNNKIIEKTENKINDSFQQELQKEKQYFLKDITRSIISISCILILLVCITLFRSQLPFFSF